MEHNIELMVCSLSELIVAPAFKSVIFNNATDNWPIFLFKMP